MRRPPTLGTAESESAGGQASLNIPETAHSGFRLVLQPLHDYLRLTPNYSTSRGQCFLRFASENPPSNYLPFFAHGGMLTTNALEKKGTDGSFIAHLEMFPRLLFSSPIHFCRITLICQLQSPEAAAGGPSLPRATARGRALAVAQSRAREGALAPRTRTAESAGPPDCSRL